jgi:ABC-2 type transport system ATP-binding protein
VLLFRLPARSAAPVSEDDRMIQVEGLTKRYGDRTAVNRLTFHAGKGEIVGFLGPNGAGKTTTMRILTGYMPPSEGSARVAGYDLLTQSLEVRRRVGYLPESVPLYPEMTVVQYLDFMAELRQIPQREDRVDEVMELVRIADRAESFVGNLSKGLRQRVGLAQALLHRPEVLILDEPMEGLDPQQQIEVKKIIREVGAEQTVLLSTHILAHAQELCNRVIIIAAGSIVAEDTPERLSTQIAGGGRVHVVVDGDGDGLCDELRGLDGVIGVRTVTDGHLEVETGPGADVRPALANAVVAGGWRLLELRRERLSLEEIFIQLTRDEAEARSAAEALPDSVSEPAEPVEAAG